MSKKLGEIFEDKNARYIEDHGISRHGISRNYCINKSIINLGPCPAKDKARET